ncbi:MAG TPA: acyltransferase [Chloroflexota bacterium]|nr:acyltransferase [Chloroflexota bacterium]
MTGEAPPTATEPSTDGLLSNVDEMPSPTWTTERSWGSLGPLTEAWARGGYLFRRFVTHRGNKVAMLRAMGVQIGQGTAIINGVRDFPSEPWLVEIGSRVTITRGVVLITHDGSSRVFRHLVPEGSRYGNQFAPVRVLDNSFVGENSILLPGVTIGPNSIVGAGSIVTKDVPPATVAAGVPARVICTLDEYVERYRSKMVPIESTDREALRRELTTRFFGKPR